LGDVESTAKLVYQTRKHQYSKAEMVNELKEFIVILEQGLFENLSISPLKSVQKPDQWLLVESSISIEL
jgi:hypothetical protein